ncbi:putative membrane or periplasmic protein [Pseudomonas saudimassiliensis]|uniref:Putative membrane or periplasmic protein n=1 Tax=Pseudomonas saudimassiliensis TaxID=1461581 RepID=A0A078MIG9_9PSED|nr:putative membrane or periplasmic protein [Pseudomonas saudimassiliensis]CEF26990.1 putative membrane or periplasmic protein [Pseudomonas saudimassiliensis]
MRIIPLSIAFSAILAGSPAMSHDFTAGDIHIIHPWSRALPPVAPTGAAYLGLENRGGQADRLIAATSPIAGRVELHEHVHQDGLMKMQQIDSVEIAPGTQVEFKPGGHHLMLFELQQTLVEGGSYPMTLTFEQAGEVEIEVKVTGEPPAASPDAHSHH